MEKKHTLLILLIIGTAFWGVSYSITKLAIGHAASSTFLFYRFFMATAVLAIIFWKHVKAINPAAIKTGAILALPLMFGIYLQTLGIRYTDASQCSFIAGMCVIILPLIKLFMYRRAAPPKIWIAALAALAGLFIISIKGQFSVNTGDLYTLIGAFGFAAYLIMVEKQSALKNLLPTIVPMFATCTLLSFMMAAGAGEAIRVPHDNAFWVGVIYCALFSTAYMYTVSNISQRYISAERVAIIYLFEPLFGAIGAFFILEESLSWRLVIGGSLIFTATIIAEVDFRKNKVIPGPVTN